MAPTDEDIASFAGHGREHNELANDTPHAAGRSKPTSSIAHVDPFLAQWQSNFRPDSTFFSDQRQIETAKVSVDAMTDFQIFNVFLTKAADVYGTNIQKTSAEWYSLIPFQILVNTNGFSDLGDRAAQSRFWHCTPVTWPEFIRRFNKCSFRFGQHSGPLFTDDDGKTS